MASRTTGASGRSTRATSTTAPARAAPQQRATGKTAVKKVATEKTAAKKVATEKTAAKKAAPEKAAAKKAAPKKTTAPKKAAPQSATTTKPSKPRTSTPSTTKPTTTKEPAKEPSGIRAPASRASGPAVLKVREDESAWTAKELHAVGADLERDLARLATEIDVAESELQLLLRDSGDGSGDDQADAGAKTFEREQEITLANNSREMFVQSQHALARIEDGTYGICESCGQAVGKMRLQAFPRATLCVSCKQQQERR